MQGFPLSLNHKAIELHPLGGVFFMDEKTLMIADVHLGKIAHFRKYGSAVPFQAVQENFHRLDHLVQHYQPQKIIFLGDLFHSVSNNEWKLFATWVSQQNASMTLVSGNHDVIPVEQFHELSVSVCEEFIFATDFLLTHHPQEEAKHFNICGHLHPGFRFRGQAKQVLKLRCFWKRPNQLILPAFGMFTGNYWIQPQVPESVYAIAETHIIPFHYE